MGATASTVRSLLASVAAGIAAANVCAAGVPYAVELDRIEGDYRTARERCESAAGHSRNVCVAEARAERRIAQSALAARLSGTPKSQYDARVARAEAEFDVAKERCGDRAGHQRELCIHEARSAEARAKDEARLARQEGESNERRRAGRAGGGAE
jgi:hypothetical protein